MKEQPRFLLCMRVAGGPSGIPAVTRMCEACGSLIWVTKVSLEAAKTHKCRLICNECLQGATMGIKEIEVKMTDEQIQELADYLSKGIG